MCAKDICKDISANSSSGCEEVAALLLELGCCQEGIIEGKMLQIVENPPLKKEHQSVNK